MEQGRREGGRKRVVGAVEGVAVDKVVEAVEVVMKGVGGGTERLMREVAERNGNGEG